MDISEAFRGEDISRTDFFDYIVAPDVPESQTLHFNRTLKSMGIFFENSAENMNATFPEMKETNNNHVVMSSPDTSASSVGNFDHGYWANCDREAVRLETSILEDLNSFGWNQDDMSGGASGQKGATNNTDGAIYTLTVLNGGEANATWYRTPEAAAAPPHPPPPQPPPPPPALLKDRDESQQSPHNIDCQQFNSGNNHPNSSSTIDLDSILSIMPNQGQTTNTTHFHPNGYHPSHHHHHQPHHHHSTETNAVSPHHRSIKSEPSQYSYDESFVNKDCSTPINHVVEGPMMESGDPNRYNNNEWKMSNTTESNAESLLRNALQGKGFMNRYNGSPKANGGAKTGEGHVELRRVLSTPPGSHGGSKTPMENSPVFLNTEVEESERKHSPMMSVSMEGNTVVMYDDAGGGHRVVGMVESETSAANTMDDILLSQLDAASYPEDYEKLKRIANEVAESVSQYCNLDHNGVPSPTHQGMYITTHLAADNLSHSNTMVTPHHSTAMSPIINTALPTVPTKSKKYSKKQSGGSNAKGNHTVPPNSVRKERSLHYCNICSKGFKDKYSVNVHIRTHTGEKPFTCTLCGKSFRQKAHLAKHYQTHIAQKNGTSTTSVSKSNNKARFVNPKPS